MMEILKLAGLSDKEIQVYVDVVKVGPIKANDIAKRLCIERTVTYNTLNKLTDKGLVTYVVQTGKKFFTATDPDNLLRPIREKEKILQEVIPQIRSLQRVDFIPLQVELFDGKEGLKAVYSLALKSKKKSFYAIGATGKAYDVLKYELPHFAKEAERRKISMHLLMNYPDRHHRVIKEPFVNARSLPKGYKNHTTILVSAEDLTIIQFLRQEKPQSLLIKNKDFAQGCRNIFEILWKSATPL